MIRWKFYKKTGLPVEINLERYMDIMEMMYFLGEEGFLIRDTNRLTNDKMWLYFVENGSIKGFEND